MLLLNSRPLYGHAGMPHIHVAIQHTTMARLNCRSTSDGSRQTSVPLTTLSTDIMSVWAFKGEGNLADKQLLRRKSSMPSTDGCRQISTDMNSRAELAARQT